MNRVHERALWKAYKENISSFESLFIVGNLVAVYYGNLQLLMTEIYRTRNDLYPSFMKQIFEKCCTKIYGAPKAKNTGLGIYIVKFFGGEVKDTLPPELKKSDSLPTFK